MNLINLTPSTTAFISFGGYFFERLENVILSASNNTLLPYVCSFSFLTQNPAFSGAFPPVSGYPLTTFTIQGDNKSVIRISNISSTPCLYDLVLSNVAGYSKLSDKNYLLIVN
jgi:hypothetical protein